MEEVPSSEMKHNWGSVADKADQAPVGITRYGRRKYVVTSAADYNQLMEMKKAILVGKLKIGIDQLDNGEYSEEPISEIIAEARLRQASKRNKRA